MTIGFTLNGKEVIAEAEPNERLIDILRESFDLKRAKSACHSGLCGACSVFYNKTITPSCLIPAFSLRGANVLTIEGFSESENCRDIIEGFKRAGVENCGYCEAGKILIAESLLTGKAPPDKDAVMLAYDSMKCRCTDAASLIRGVEAAWEVRSGRLRREQQE
ncbi:MAG: 2Fe-2S iron-sulfur cluster binding domain-containing protein [Spirochaetaceae bacterium]|jgi:carbon-monoxide dehydrogenase small subunit|nr:2Fe-2S iron-sulfur cluster binding domain-containing protein [Spirochaetaceae bacterium]